MTTTEPASPTKSAELTPELLGQVLGLTAAAREELAVRLLDSLTGPPPSDPAAVRAAWNTELARRIAEIDSGQVALVDSGVVFADLRDRLRQRGTG
ncbi:MAG: addiction module protein [Fimbriiglobus sp.]